MNERIKQLRKALGLTQAEFGSRISMKQNTVAQIEGGRNTSKQTIFAICREFGVNEEWLRTGTGEMFNTVSDTEMEALAQLYGLDDLDRRIVQNYMRLNETDRAAVKRYVRSLVAAQQSQPTGDSFPMDEAAIEREVEAYRAQLLAQQKGEAGSSASSGTPGA